MKITSKIRNEEFQVNLNVLSTQELQDLLHVPCTVEQAAQIKARNEYLLSQLNKAMPGKPYSARSTFGCPHCSSKNGWFKCWANPKSCDWSYLPEKLSEDFMCVNAKFGGVSFEDVSEHIGYSADSEEICYDYETDTQKMELFLKGHIEWVNVVIQIGGVNANEEWKVK
jgi:hypothetical protein